MARQEREVCLFTFAQGCYILGEMQDLMKEDFLGAPETERRKAECSTEQPGGRSRREGIQQAGLSIAKTGRTAVNCTHQQAEARVWLAVTQAKERFRMRASLEERITRR